jgi:hypothetical protein
LWFNLVFETEARRCTPVEFFGIFNYPCIYCESLMKKKKEEKKKEKIVIDKVGRTYSIVQVMYGVLCCDTV